MERQGSIRDRQREDVLALLDRGRNLTRGEIARALHLTRSTVSEVLGGLLDQGIVTVTEQRAPGGRGRPAEVLGLHPGAVRHLGLDFSHIAVTLCLANAAGDVIASATTEYPEGTGWEERARLAFRAVEDLAVGEVHLEHLAGVGIGLPGPNSASWLGFPTTSTLEPFHLVKARIREQFAHAFDCPVLVDHHIRFAALHEATRAGDGEQDIVYLRLSTGIGGAVLGAGTTLRGAHLLAGEIGHMIVDDSAGAQGCRCGRRGCLETVASLGAVTRTWQQIAGQDADLDHLAAAHRAGDAQAQELFAHLARLVGRVLGIAALVIDPDEIILAGEIGELLEPVLPLLIEEMSRQCLTGDDIRMRCVRSDRRQGALGAVAALRSADRPPTSRRSARAPALSVPDEGGPRVR